MSRATRKLEEQYAIAMEECIAGGGENALERAYELGRNAMVDGRGVLEISAIYHQSLTELLRRTHTLEEGRDKVNAAGCFFAESLSPYEMAQRGFQESYASLRRLNESLALRAKELQRANLELVREISEHQRARVEIVKLNAELELRAVELEASNKELESFSYSVSHDLRAPLRSIDGFSQALVEDYGDKLDGDAADSLRRVRLAAQRMAQLIDDLLGLARVTRAEMHRSSVDLSALADSIVEELRRAAPEQEGEFIIQRGLTVEADGPLVRIALVNLLGNAWKFTSRTSSARIEFGSTERERKRVFYVRDNGAGFDMAYASKLFGAFQRLHGIDDFPGTGIGLATVQRVVRRHGGNVWAEGEIDHGATFYFTL